MIKCRHFFALNNRFCHWERVTGRTLCAFHLKQFQGSHSQALIHPADQKAAFVYTEYVDTAKALWNTKETPMSGKQEVIVNGVKLTREQVENALKELNAPPPSIVFRGGDVVTVDGSAEYLVLSKTMDEAYRMKYTGSYVAEVTTVALATGLAHSFWRYQLTLVKRGSER